MVKQKKGCTFAPAFKTSERGKRLKKIFKKDLVNWKKGYTFAPANEATSSLRNIDNTAQKDLD